MNTTPDKSSITKEEVMLLIKQLPLQLKIIDVRSKDEYLEKHIEGAIHIPLDDLVKQDDFFDRNDYLITACSKGGGRSIQGAEILRAMGYKNVHWLEGGTFGWL